MLISFLQCFCLVLFTEAFGQVRETAQAQEADAYDDSEQGELEDEWIAAADSWKATAKIAVVREAEWLAENIEWALLSNVADAARSIAETATRSLDGATESGGVPHSWAMAAACWENAAQLIDAALPTGGWTQDAAKAVAAAAWQTVTGASEAEMSNVASAWRETALEWEQAVINISIAHSKPVQGMELGHTSINTVVLFAALLIGLFMGSRVAKCSSVRATECSNDGWLNL
eukprot:gnl/MRDRNA2_/MRDRNA2_68197_c0_seq1.p1 gnl/MRDRNA2_/MRDRNA2_68197_c0~~gnl/MRDRNA2_/MRDRNA2_68197_c0_seq1.p1  ORF type:complete len:232 (+),score=44.63 gnl/MRDRNA2_/MRDRNA2_68197_c0_seq1:103-798(+)